MSVKKKIVCPRRGEEKKKRGFQAIVVVEKRFYDVGEKNFVSRKRREKKRKRIPSHRCCRKKVLSEKKIVDFFSETKSLG